MNKSNVFKSSPFYMSAGDILHIIIRNETGTTATFDLTTEGRNLTPQVPEKPVLIDITDIDTGSFTVNWYQTVNATGYYLDVATDSAFTGFATGFNNKDVGNVVTADVTTLDSSRTYYVRLRAYNSTGASENSDTLTATTTAVSVTDADGNVYTYVTIGTQQWLVENLRTTKYNNGDPISNVTDTAAWLALVDGGYCWYDNDIVYKPTYGALYNWYAATDVRGVAPTGWRVPSATDYDTLITFLGGTLVAGGKLKELGISHWITPNTGATDEYGFKGVPSGDRDGVNGLFYNLTYNGIYWTTTNPAVNQVTAYYLSYNLTEARAVTYTETPGLAIRCVRDL